MIDFDDGLKSVGVALPALTECGLKVGFRLIANATNTT